MGAWFVVGERLLVLSLGSGRVARGGQNQTGCFFADHDGGRVGVTAGHARDDGGVGNHETRDAVDPARRRPNTDTRSAR